MQSQTEIKCTIEPRERMWRQLVRVILSEWHKRWFYVVVPGWSPFKEIRIDFNDVPQNIRMLVQNGKRFHAKFNLGETDISELRFSDWEES